MECLWRLRKEKRSDALNIMGISSQLIFLGFAARRFARPKVLAVVYGGCDELNRGMADFSVDELRSYSERRGQLV